MSYLICRRIMTVLIGVVSLCPSLVPLTAPAQEAAALFAALGNSVRFTNLSIEHGLSEATVYAMAQDRQGFLWFATQNGLNRYDGATFVVYKHDDNNPASLSNNFILALLVDHEGMVWVGTTIGGVDRFDPATGQFHHYQYNPQNAQSLSHHQIRVLYEDRQGAVWVGTGGGGLNRWNRATGQFTRYQHDESDPASLSQDNIAAIYEDRRGQLWVGSKGGGLDRMDRQSGKFIHYRAQLNSDSVSAIAEDPSGRLWVGTLDGGVNVLDPATERFTVYRHEAQQPQSLSSDTVRSIMRDQTGAMWVGTTGGLNRFQPDTAQFVQYLADPADPSSLSENTIFSMYEDAGGVLWFGSVKGVNVLNRRLQQFGHYKHRANDPASLMGNAAFDVFEDHLGAIWVATFGSGAVDRMDPATGQFTHYQHDPNNPRSLAKGTPRVVYEDRAGAVWIGFDGAGLDKFDRQTGQFTHYRHDPQNPQSLTHNELRDIYEDRAGNFWVATYGGGLDKFDRATGVFTHYRADPQNPRSLATNAMAKVYEDRRGNLWVGSGAGLHKMNRETGEFERYQYDPQNPQSLSNNMVYSIYEDQAGTLWIGTLGGGLNKFTPPSPPESGGEQKGGGTFTRYGAAQGLTNEAVTCMLEDDEQQLWLSTFGGLARFNPAQGTFRMYHDSDGLQSDAFVIMACHRRANGQLLFGGKNGFNLFDPRQIQDNPYVPPIRLTDFQIFNKPVPIGQAVDGEVILPQALDLTKSLRLSYRYNVFSFEFAALSFANPKRNQYAYMLEGFDQEWIPTTAQRRYVTYTNLKGGDYVLRVKGSNDSGVWNTDGVALQITIIPPFWQTWWFRIGFSALVLGSILGGAAWRVQRIKAQKRHLEAVVTERTAALHERENRLRTIFETSQAGIILVDQHGIITFANQRMADMFKCALSDLFGSAYLSHIHPEQEQIGAEKMRQLIGGEFKALSVERRYRCADGSDFWGLLSGRRQEDEEGQLIALVGIISDITDRKQTEEALKHAKEAAESANQAKSAFIANMSHELRSPLNAILGFAHVMLRSKRLDTENMENLGIIARSGEHLLTLINQVLDLSKIEAGKMTLNPRPFDLGRLLDDVEDMFRLKAEDKQLRLAFERGADVPFSLNTDELKLRQVLINLLNNALKFTPAGGVTVRVSAVNLTEQRARLRFEVEDTGPGIPPEEMGKLFEAFEQTSSGRQSQEGTGLGLPISRKFVQLMGGDMEARSQVGVGATFNFEIDAERLTDEASSVATPKTHHVIALEPGQPRYRILVVDDKPLNRLLLVKLLQPFGFELREAEHGRDALRVWEEWEPHLIWMDMRMPVMDGYEATKRIKATTKGQATAVIALTASMLEEERAVTLSAGCDDFLRKPFREQEIFDLLSRHLGARFVYEEEQPVAATPSANMVDLPTAFAQMPPELLNQLRHAADLCDITLLDQIIGKMRRYQPAAADALLEWANNFEYEKILGAL